MQIPFENMPPNARLWVYQADKNLNEKEVNLLQESLNEQIEHWAAHGAPLLGAFKVLHQRFIIIAVDESYNGTSGCSIDASTNWLKALGQQLNINFFDRNIAYIADNEINTVDFLNVKRLVLDGLLQPNTLIFNNLVNTIHDFNQNWKIEASESWLKKYFITNMTL
jgi:hypothetical protein